MKRIFNLPFYLAHVLLIATVILVILPGKKITQPNTALLLGIALIELYYLWKLYWAFRAKKSTAACSSIIILIWALLFCWELVVTKLNLMHPVLYPSPENVFYVFQTQYQTLLLNVVSSLQLLLISIAVGLGAGVIFGVIVGWVPFLRDVFYPIANVLAPIPAVVYAPYIIAIMPSFRSASAMVIALGIFFPAFLNMILRVKSIDAQIIDSAKILNVSNRTMVTQILIPYILPGLVSNLRVTLTTSIMLLMFAEMMGATKGLGYYIVNYNTYGNYTNVIACIIVVGILVTFLNWVVSEIQKRAIKWQ